MASDRRGKQIDIHSGGIDLAFPHHDNELAQSEAYWYEKDNCTQWINYFLHMGHLSIAGAKMSKSLKNFTTIREALNRGRWTARGLRIVFLLGSWREGIEITEDLIKAGNVWEEKLDNFFLNSKRLTLLDDLSSDSSTALAIVLENAKAAVHEALADSFNTPAAMGVISDLISQYNNMDKPELKQKDIKATALWVTSMVNTFGLDGATSPEDHEIGWEGIDIPEYAKLYVFPLSNMRDGLREAARTPEGIGSERLESIMNPKGLPKLPGEGPSRPFADLLCNFRAEASLLEESSDNAKQILGLCDRVRDIGLFDLGIHLEDRDNEPALVRPISKAMNQARQEQAERARQKRAEKERREIEALQKAEKGKLDHKEVFKTSNFSEWDGNGI